MKWRDGMRVWNESQKRFDFTIPKTTKINERIGFTFYSEFLNALNHMEFNDPGQYGAG